MSRFEYQRADYVIAVRTEGEGARLSAGGASTPVPPEDLAILRRGQGGLDSASLRARQEVLPAWLDAFEREVIRLRLEQTLPPSALGARVLRLERVVLEIDPELADIAWEHLCQDTVQVVRVSHVRSKGAETPLQLPLRILELDPAPDGWSIKTLVDDLLGRGDVIASQGVLVAWAPRYALHVFRRRSRWPTADIVHLHDALFLSNLTRPLTTLAPGEAGTLGWFLRLAGWQTRLITIALSSDADWPLVRRLANELLAKGGAAVVASVATPEQWHNFYAELIHDRPVDFAAMMALPREGTMLWLGGGREEALRPSNVGVHLLSLTEGPAGKHLPPAFRQELDRFKDDWQGYHFELHERGGLLPLASQVLSLRRALGPPPREVATPQHRSDESPLTPRNTDEIGPTAAQPVPRHLNATLWRERGAGIVAFDQLTDRLTPTERVHLGLNVGRKATITQQEWPLLEDTIKWPLRGGTWVELVVTPLDFSLDGSPAQELWLPRVEDSERVYFALVPRPDRPMADVARVRFGLYQNNNLIQCWLLAVVLNAEADASAILAHSLALDDHPAPLGFLARPEFSARTVDDERPCPPRTLSLLANNLDGKKHLMIKGADLAVPVDPEGKRVEDAVRRLREALDAVTASPLKDPTTGEVLDPSLQYRYQTPDEGRLRKDLQTLARAGWSLYRAVAPNHTHSALTERLCGTEATIQAVHTDLRSTIPWSLIYDRLFDPDLAEVGGEPVEPATCLGALPHPDGSLPFKRCGESEQCELHPTRLKKRKEEGRPSLAPKTVACPLHFWGFAHRVEIPPQTVSTAQVVASSRAADAVENNRPVVVGVGYYPFSCWAAHLEELRALPQVSIRGPSDKRDAVLELLGADDLDLLYLFCHAEDGTLRFNRNLRGSDRISADDVDFVSWAHRPLAVLNGCGTAGWSPSAIAPLIETFTHNQAGGVIGTEVRVHEAFGARIGRELLALFLSGRTVGEALLTVRRKLLSELNPLGLVYTLYGATELGLRKPSGEGRQ
jgi:hypothetical protein